MEKIRAFFDWLERAKLLYDLLAVVVEWKTAKAILTHLTHLPSDVASAIAWGGAAALLFILHRFAYKERRHGQISPSSTSTALTASQDDFSIPKFTREAYKSDLGPEFEVRALGWVGSVPERDRDRESAKFISSILIAYFYDETWWGIFRSQLLALEFLNSGPVARDVVKVGFYDVAAAEAPDFYGKYSFDTWIAFLLQRVLILELPGGAIGITQRGKDFLKYVVHHGYVVGSRAL